MKLIVLYGDEECGKTITLKMVYEELKKHNLFDTNWFRYYNRNREHTDFQDVLIIDKSKIYQIDKPPIANNQNNNSSMVSSTSMNNAVQKIQDFEKKIQQFVTNCSPLQKDDIENLINNNNLFEDKIEDWEKKNEKVIGEVESYEDNYKSPIIDDNKIKNQIGHNINYIKVGFVLEGDYGFVHVKPKKNKIMSYKHQRNLYKHLLKLIKCDVIICSCTIYDTSNIVEQPYLCLLAFMIYYYRSQKNMPMVFPLQKTLGNNLWSNKICVNQNDANVILRNI